MSETSTMYSKNKYLFKNYIMKNFYYLILILIVSSCATLFASKSQTLSFNSDPDKAIVYVNGERKGTTPLQLSLNPSKYYTIEFRKEGHKSITKTLTTKVGITWIILDVLGGFVPIIVDAATGNWKEFDQEVINSNLEKK